MIENRKCKNYAKFIGTIMFYIFGNCKTYTTNSFKLCKDKLNHMFQIMIILFYFYYQSKLTETTKTIQLLFLMSTIWKDNFM